MRARGPGGSLPLSTQEIHPRILEASYRRELAELVKENAMTRLWAKDLTLWPQPDTASRNPAILNWLDLPQRMRDYMPQVVARAQQLETLGFQTLVFVGMGSSNLAAEAIAH